MPRPPRFLATALVIGFVLSAAHVPSHLRSVQSGTTVEHLLPAADTYANEDFPDTSYGSALELRVARTTEFLTLRRAFLRFDLSAIPSGATVVSATLRIYHTSGTGPPVLIGVRPVTSTWAPGTLTWRNQPPAGQSVANAALTDRAGWTSWQVSSLVQSWLDGSVPNQGVSLRGPETSSVEWEHDFDSREGNEPPVLDIELDVPPTATPTPTSEPCVDAYEPNDDMGHAAPLEAGVEVTGCIPTPSDRDFFTFFAAPFTHVTLELYDLPVNLDLALIGSDGRTLADSTQGGTTPERVEYATGPSAETLYGRVASAAGAWDLFRGYHAKLTLSPEVATATTTPSTTLEATATDAAPATATATETQAPTATITPEASPTSATGQTATPSKTATPRPSATATPEWATIGGRVWDDRDRDGRQDERERGIDQVSLTLIRDGAALGQTTTDIEGYYAFTTVAGEAVYRVDVADDTIPVPMTLTTCCDPVIVRPHAGQDIRSADFGYAMPPTPAATATAFSVPPNMDLAIAGIEVTQATQCFGEPLDLDGCAGGDNSVPLVAGKTTVARVYVTMTRAGPGDPTATRAYLVHVSLLGWDAGTGELLPGGPLDDTITRVNADVPLSNVREYASRSANFQLPDEWTQTGPSGISLSAVVESHAVECPACDGNNEATERGVVFAPSGTIEIYPVRIHYNRGDNDVWPSENAADGLYAKLTKLYPVDEENVIVHDALVMNTSRNLGKNEGISELLDDMADRFVCYNDNFEACGWREGHYYGVISTTVQLGPLDPDDPEDVTGRWNGMGRIYDCVAVGREGRLDTAAHEIGHNLGREHAGDDHGEAEGGGWEEWPYPHGGIGTVGFDTTAMRARRIGPDNGLHWHDVMSYGYGLGKWISPHTYEAFERDLEFCTAGSPGVMASAVDASPGADPGRYWLLSGTLKPAPALRPIYQVSARPGASAPSGPGQYAAELQDAGGVVLARRVFDPIEDHFPEAESLGHFRQLLPDVGGVAQVVLFDGATEIARRGVSAHAPTVTVLEPTANTRWGASGVGTVRWTGADQDGDPLTYVVMYSRDGGATWVNLATGLTTTSFGVALEALGGTPGDARIRVLANDGMRSGSGDSPSFTVARRGPHALIELPESTDMPFAEGAVVRLQGRGTDREDGVLTGRSLEWRDAQGRLLGTGTALVLPDLGAGLFLVRFVARDADGNSDEARITLTVGEAIYLPTLADKAVARLHGGRTREVARR